MSDDRKETRSVNKEFSKIAKTIIQILMPVVRAGLNGLEFDGVRKNIPSTLVDIIISYFSIPHLHISLMPGPWHEDSFNGMRGVSDNHPFTVSISQFNADYQTFLCSSDELTAIFTQATGSILISIDTKNRSISVFLEKQPLPAAAIVYFFGPGSTMGTYESIGNFLKTLRHGVVKLPDVFPYDCLRYISHPDVIHPSCILLGATTIQTQSIAERGCTLPLTPAAAQKVISSLRQDLRPRLFSQVPKINALEEAAVESYTKTFFWLTAHFLLVFLLIEASSEASEYPKDHPEEDTRFLTYFTYYYCIAMALNLIGLYKIALNKGNAILAARTARQQHSTYDLCLYWLGRPQPPSPYPNVSSSQQTTRELIEGNLLLEIEEIKEAKEEKAFPLDMVMAPRQDIKLDQQPRVWSDARAMQHYSFLSSSKTTSSSVVGENLPVVLEETGSSVPLLSKKNS